jgi:hypothetical protein
MKDTEDETIISVRYRERKHLLSMEITKAKLRYVTWISRLFLTDR